MVLITTAGLSTPQRLGSSGGCTKVSRSRPGPAPFVMRTADGMKTVLQHSSCDRYPINWEAHGRRRQQVHDSALDHASKARSGACSRAYDSAKEVATPRDWRVRCNRTAEKFTAAREEERRNAVAYYHTIKPDLAASGRYHYARYGLGNYDTGLSTGSSQYATTPYDEHSAGMKRTWMTHGSGSGGGAPMR